MKNAFDNIILIGRPASGKSEFTDYIKRLSTRETIEKFRIGKIVEIDDFPWLWEKFMEDNVWEKLGYKRLCSKSYPDGNFGLDPDHTEYMDLLVHKFNYEINKRYLPNSSFYNENTLLIEFSRGGSDAYRRSLNLLSPEILKKSVILYTSVSFAESCRKNTKRYEEKKQHSILAHKVDDELMEKYYNTDDWKGLTNNKETGMLVINNIKIPFTSVSNEPESTDPKVLDERYSKKLTKLFEVYNGKGII